VTRRRTGRLVPLSTLYATLVRLEARGYVRSQLGSPSPDLDLVADGNPVGVATEMQHGEHDHLVEVGNRVQLRAGFLPHGRNIRIALQSQRRDSVDCPAGRVADSRGQVSDFRQVALLLLEHHLVVDYRAGGVRPLLGHDQRPAVGIDLPRV
jgi:hypothetical protein